MTYQQASARVLDRIRLNNRRRNHLVANPDDAEFERSDERDDELAAEQAAGDAAVNEIVAAIPANTQQPLDLFQFTHLERCDSFSTLGS